MNKNLSALVKAAMLAAMSAVLMLFEFPIFPTAGFLKLSLSDFPALIAGFVLGPLYGGLVVIIKVAVFLVAKGSDSGYVGELSKAIIGLSFVLTSSLIFLAGKSNRSALIGLIAGMLLMTAVGALSNYYVIFPLYSGLYGMDLQVLRASMPFVLLFNIISGTVNALPTFFVYRRTERLLKRF